LSFFRNASEVLIYLIILLSPIPYGSVENLWKFLIIAGISLTGIIFSIKLLKKPAEKVIVPRYFKILLIMILLFLISTLISPRPEMGSVSFMFFSSLILFGFILINFYTSSDRIKRLITIILISAVSMCLYSITKAFATESKITTDLGSIFTYVFYNRNHFAGFLELTAPFALAMFIFIRTENKTVNIAIGVLAIFLFTSLLLTLSRGGIGSFALAFLLINIIYFKNYKTSFSLSSVSAVMIYMAISLKPLWQRLSYDRISSSTDNRWLLWKSSLLGIMDRPLLGWGAGNYSGAYLQHRDGIQGIVSYAHNDYLQTIAEMGIPVWTVLLLVLFGIFLGGLIEVKRRRNPFLYYVGVASAFAVLSIIFHSVVDFNLMIPSNALYFVTVFAIFIVSTFTERKGKIGFYLIQYINNAAIKKTATVFAFLLSLCFFVIAVSFIYKEILYRKASNLYLAGNWEDSEAILTKIEQLPLNLPQYYSLHCKILNKKGLLKNNPSILKTAAEKCQKSAEIDPFDPFYALDSATVFEELGNKNIAEHYYKLSSEIDPNSPYFSLSLAEFYLRSGEKREAENIYNLIIKKNLDNLPLVMKSMLKNKWELEDFTRTLVLENPELLEPVLHFFANQNLQDNYLALFFGHIDNSRKFSSPEFYIYTARYLSIKNSTDQAMEILKIAVRNFPDDKRAYLELMEIMFRAKNYNDLIILSSESEKKFEIPEILCYRAKAYLEIEQYADALKYAKACLSKNPNSNKFRKLLYDIYIRMGLEYEAMQALGDPSTFGKEDLHFMMLRASLFESWGKTEDALKEYRKILYYDKQNRHAIQKIMQLAKNTEN